MTKEDFVNKILQQQKLKKIKENKERDRLLRYYSCESCHSRNVGKRKDYKIIKSKCAH